MTATPIPRSEEAAPTIYPRVIVRDAVGRQVGSWQNALLTPSRPDNAEVRAVLARLRRTSAAGPGAADGWAITLPVVPPELLGRGDEPSDAERAVHATLVLFAHHAQSAKDRVHQRGRRLGLAVKQLSQGDGGPGAHSRFVAVATASTWAQRMFHLRGLVALLRSHGVALDYAELACDLYLLQRPGRADSVRLRWGRDRYGGSGLSHGDTTNQPPPDSADSSGTTDTTAEES